MQVKVLQENLRLALHKVNRVIDSRPVLPVLANVLLESADGTLRVTATNGEATISTYVGAKVEAEGAITVPAKQFGDFISSLNEGAVSLSADYDRQRLETRQGRSVLNLNGISADEFPKLPELAISKSLLVPLETLRWLIDRTLYAAAATNSAPIYTGVCFVLSKDTLLAKATNQFRAALAQVAVEDGWAGEYGIPARSLDYARAVLDENDDVTISLAKAGKNEQFILSDSRTSVYTLLIEGRFPKLEHLMTQGYEDYALIPTDALKQVITRANILARDAEYQAAFQFAVEDQVIAISLERNQRGAFEEVVDASVSGASGLEKVDLRYLNDAISPLRDGGSEVVIYHRTESPFIIREAKMAEGRDSVAIIMPLRDTSPQDAQKQKSAPTPA